MNPGVAITAEPGCEDQARRLAQRLGLEYMDHHDPAPPFLLQFAKGRLQLQQTGDKAPGPVYVEFAQGKAAHRRRQGEGRKTPLARAAGRKAGFLPDVIDGTAGLGQDAFVLATLGCRVRLVERSPIIHALLEDGLRRAAASPQTGEIVSRMSLVLADTAEYLRSLPAPARPDTIYLDPMYPHRGGKALSKKEMQALQKLLGEDRSGPGLLHVARQTAGKRVVVKRPRKAPFLGGQRADFQICAPNTRFDVYLTAPPADSA
ncbi:class I SAM-dependent methyltransferase [Thiolapillus sp.]